MQNLPLSLSVNTPHETRLLSYALHVKALAFPWRKTRQPRFFTLICPMPDKTTQSTIDALIAKHRNTAGALLPLLHAIQENIGFIPPDAVPEIARCLNLSRAEVHGVISYYHFFRTTKPAQHTLCICRAESCLACGSNRLFPLAEALLADVPKETVALEAVDCLGLCAASPAMQVDGYLHAAVSPDKLEKILVQLTEA